MERVYVIEPGSFLRREGECLRVSRRDKADGEKTFSHSGELIPASDLERLTLVGRASLTGPVLDFLIDHRIDTVFMTASGRFRARLLLGGGGHVGLRQRQYAKLGDNNEQLRLARIIVHGKLENQIRLLIKRARGEASVRLREIAARLRALQKRLPAESSLEAIRGLEGYGARVYFEGFHHMMTNPLFSFTGRNRRPPRDPVNALLSFVYTLFTNEVLSAVQAAGLDPYLGALHAEENGRPSLACDLVEEWRPMADRLVLTLLNKAMVRPEDFVVRKEENGLRPVEMKPAAMRALVAAYERQMQAPLTEPETNRQVAVRWLIHGQVRRLVRHLGLEGVTYVSFLIPV